MYTRVPISRNILTSDTISRDKSTRSYIHLTQNFNIQWCCASDWLYNVPKILQEKKYLRAINSQYINI